MYLNPEQEKILKSLVGQTIEIPCKHCDNILQFDALSVFMGGETLVCGKCGKENFRCTDDSALENLLSLFPDKNNLS